MSRNGHLAHAPFSDSPSFVDSCLFNTTRKKKSADLRVFFIYLKIEKWEKRYELEKTFSRQIFQLLSRSVIFPGAVRHICPREDF